MPASSWNPNAIQLARRPRLPVPFCIGRASKELGRLGIPGLGESWFLLMVDTSAGPA